MGHIKKFPIDNPLFENVLRRTKKVKDKLHNYYKKPCPLKKSPILSRRFYNAEKKTPLISINLRDYSLIRNLNTIEQSYTRTV